MQELKIRIKESQRMEKHLLALGARFIEEKMFIDTYFNQPPGKVLKLAKINDRYFLENLKAIDGKFSIITDQEVTKPEMIKKELEKKFGIATILQGKRNVFQLDKFKIVLNIIDDIGGFLIVTGENPTEDFITNKLGIIHPEYIRVPFNQLQKVTLKDKYGLLQR